MEERIENRTLIIGALGGFTHIIIIGIPYLYLFGLRLLSFDGLYTSLMSIYVVLGAFLLGAMPAALLSRKRLFSPALVVASIAALALISSWSGANRPRLAGPSNVDFYFLFWVGPLVVALIVGWAEHGLRNSPG